MGNVIGTVFYSDQHGKYLTGIKSPRYTTVYMNQWGDYFYGSSHGDNAVCTKTAKVTETYGHKPLYRIVVRRKNV